jgi:hypothetical protein
VLLFVPNLICYARAALLLLAVRHHHAGDAVSAGAAAPLPSRGGCPLDSADYRYSLSRGVLVMARAVQVSCTSLRRRLISSTASQPGRWDSAPSLAVRRGARCHGLSPQCRHAVVLGVATLAEFLDVVVDW